MALFAAGIWRFESRLQRTRAVLLSLCGAVTLALAAARNGPGWGLRFAILGMYSAVGGLLGSTAAIISAKRRAGEVLANLGMAVTTGFKVFSAIAIPVGIISVVMQFLDARQPGSLMLVGQGLLFATFGIQAVLMVKTPWCLAEQGIVGPNMFVPWHHVSAWGWQDSNTLAIVLKPAFRRARRFTISVVPEARERAAAILATKIPA